MSRSDVVSLTISPSCFLLDERTFLTLGPLKIAAVLEREGYIVEVLDLSGVENYEEAAREHARTSEACFFGISATTPQMPFATKIRDAFVSANPNAKTIIGGPHPTLINAAYKSEKKRGIVNGRAFKALEKMKEAFDVVVAGDGEFAILEVLKNGATFVDADDPKGSLFMTDKMYEESPMPARHLCDVSSYHYEIEGVNACHLIGQLGCPFACFPSGTSVMMSDGGSKKIEDIQIGDCLTSLNETTLEIEETAVKKIFVHYDEALFTIRTSSGRSVAATGEHPFLIKDDESLVGWQQIQHVRPGSRIAVISDRKIIYETIEFVEQGPELLGSVYNLECYRNHNFVAETFFTHNCNFCGGRESNMLRRIRTRTTGSILGEMRFLHDTYGFNAFNFFDDELNVSKSMIELMNGIYDLSQELGQKFALRGFVKSELFNPAQAAAMRRAGFNWILTGFESGSSRILENVNKKATKEQNSRCVQIAMDQGLKVKALMSIGHAGESEETVNDTAEWLTSTPGISEFDVTCISVFAGTPYYDLAVETSPGIWTFTAPKSGDRLHSYDLNFDTDSGYYKGIPGEYKSFVFTDYLTAERLVELRDSTEKLVREQLGIPYNKGAPSVRFESSMGQLPSSIFRRTAAKIVRESDHQIRLRVI